MLLLVVHIRGGLYNVHIAGGSSQNQLLCQIAADATQRPVIAGPVEATALDNASVQWIALGELSSITEARALVRDSFDLVIYQPGKVNAWEAAFLRFRQLGKI